MNTEMEVVPVEGAGVWLRIVFSHLPGRTEAKTKDSGIE
jgi:hypothetical protein